jgi:hydrogenase maturation protein HypF
MRHGPRVGKSNNCYEPLSAVHARRWMLDGRVQGVGFRPFVYRLAQRYGLKGCVQNLAGQVEIHAEGAAASLVAFEAALLHEAPPLARPRILTSAAMPTQGFSTFSIVASRGDAAARIHVPPDYFACDDCLRELRDPHDRRYRYPFINCTQCGPRYTLITRLPYDRPNTTLAGFTLCTACCAEYENPLDRRFHAEPVACPRCGPVLQYRAAEGALIEDSATALSTAVAALRSGRILAVKGIGGYHLMCDAGNTTAVMRLRARKPRPHKPLAVMFPWRGDDGLDAVRESLRPDAMQAQLLCDPMRPIVLIPRRSDAALTPTIAPGLNEVGAFLPYSPLHHLLLDDFDAPLVATSANISGEPVLTDNAEVEARLPHVAEAFLHHNRTIARPADDPVYRVIAGRPRPLRLGRGSAPLELTLPCALAQPLLAVGGHMKNTIALAWEDRIVISPHIGDLDAPRSLEVFEQVINDLQDLYQISATRIVCDAHPGYASTRWARRSALPVQTVLHHHAHASALAGEYPDVQNWLVFTWDGVGYGADGSLWGGEALHGAPGHWQRAASFRPFHLPGGERAGREPWRSAAALCWENGIAWKSKLVDIDLVQQAWAKRINAPATSAVGRLFDAASALLGLIETASFEGQGPMLLEAICSTDTAGVSLPLAPDAEGVLRSDWAPLLPYLLDEQRSVGERAAGFHASLAQALLDQALALRELQGAFVVGLVGGVFQNRVLTERAVTLLRTNDFEVRLAITLPCNDAGISFGQVIEVAHRGEVHLP